MGCKKIEKFFKMQKSKNITCLKFDKYNISTYLSEIINNKSFSYLEEIDGLFDDLYAKDKRAFKDRKSGIIKYITEENI